MAEVMVGKVFAFFFCLSSWCSQCQGDRYVKDEDDRVHTCPNCRGRGREYERYQDDDGYWYRRRQFIVRPARRRGDQLWTRNRIMYLLFCLLNNDWRCLQ